MTPVPTGVIFATTVLLLNNCRNYCCARIVQDPPPRAPLAPSNWLETRSRILKDPPNWILLGGGRWPPPRRVRLGGVWKLLERVLSQFEGARRWGPRRGVGETVHFVAMGPDRIPPTYIPLHSRLFVFPVARCAAFLILFMPPKARSCPSSSASACCSALSLLAARCNQAGQTTMMSKGMIKGQFPRSR